MNELALWLRSQRSRSGLTYAQLAERTGFSASSLSRATKGDRLPTLIIVEAFTMGCGGDVDKAAALWRRARYAIDRSERGGSVATLPEYVHNFVQLHAALLELYKKAGSPPLRFLETSIAGQYGRLPRSTVSRVLRGQAIPRKEMFLNLVRACGTTIRVEVGDWEAAWERANGDRRYDRAFHRNTGAGSDGTERLGQALRIAERRARKLQEARITTVRRRADILHAYQALQDRSDPSAFWIEDDEIRQRRRHLLRQLVAADTSVTTLQLKIEKTEEYIAILTKRLIADKP